MECIIPFLLLVFIIGLLVFLMSKAQTRSDRWNRAFRAVAQRYGGQCVSAGWFGRPSVRFRYGNTSCFLNTISAGHNRTFTQLLIQWPDAKFRVEVVPRWRADQLWRLRGMFEFDTGKAEFDQRYIIRTNDGDMANAWFTEGVQWQIDRLRSQSEVDDVYLGINRGGLTIKTPGFLKDMQTLDDYVRYGLELYDQALLTRSKGIEFVGTESVQLLGAVTCQVCGDEIGHDMVFCVRCRTPHCRECWEYAGQCSTYGCGETRHTSPIVADPLND